jgi:hypothetical protein
MLKRMVSRFRTIVQLGYRALLLDAGTLVQAISADAFALARLV